MNAPTNVDTDENKSLTLWIQTVKSPRKKRSEN